MKPIEFIEPTARSRLKFVLVHALAIGFVVAVKIFWPRVMDFVNSLPLCNQLPWLQGIAAAFFALSPLTALFLFWHAERIRSSNQAPPPGAIVFFRTPIKRGRAAMLQVYLCRITGIAAILLPLYFGAKIWPSISPVFISVAECQRGGT